MNYSVGLEVYEPDGTKQLNVLKYSNLNDLVDKKLKFILELKKASEIPEKLNFEIQCRYTWLDEDKT